MSSSRSTGTSGVQAGIVPSHAAIAQARTGDVVLIAGKGHEDYQILRDRTVPFDDRMAARAALRALRGT